MNPKIMTPDELKKRLREANHDLDRVDEIIDTILEQKKLEDMENSINKNA